MNVLCNYFIVSFVSRLDIDIFEPSKLDQLHWSDLCDWNDTIGNQYNYYY